MKANSKHYILLLVGMITLVVTGAGYWYVYSTTVEQAQKQSALVEEIKNNEQSNQQEVRLLEISASTAEKRNTLNSYFVSDDRILDFIKSIESVSKDSSSEVVLSNITTDDLTAESVGAIGHVKLHVEVKGAWLSVNKALSLIENLPYSISVSSVNLRSYVSDAVSADKKTTQKKSLWNMSLDIDALTMK